MKRYGLIGYPLSHSFSKKFFTDKFEKEGLKDCVYENFPLEKIEQLGVLIKSDPSLLGFNVTIPYKEQVLHFLAGANQLVKSSGACNCIKIADGKLYGFNTDIIAFEQSLQHKLKPHHSNALILGTGGAAKAVQFVLQKLGIRYQYVSRKKSMGNLSYDELTDKVIASHLLIVNTTPLGMFPQVVEAPPIPYKAIGPQHFLFDLIYNPEKTLFLQKGEERGAAIQNGYEMLVLQAEESWRIWNEGK
ncbi:MAG: shikimate dehydrogenase [Chitinophagaceae bacterium]|nr:shikimate dehydrogenase [Chitinophagaceae bacterium]